MTPLAPHWGCYQQELLSIKVMKWWKAIVEALLSASIPIWVCEACAKGRNLTPENWIETASYKTMGDYVSAALNMDKSLNF
jgi:sulfur relay (sulfurtransferase) complex TusBCD TusD component (DsrE family)